MREKESRRLVDDASQLQTVITRLSKLLRVLNCCTHLMMDEEWQQKSVQSVGNFRNDQHQFHIGVTESPHFLISPPRTYRRYYIIVDCVCILIFNSI